ncbi:MAG: 3-deoxy-D-manno-octulosonic acid transferase [Planctomycetes bacterium]|nr:3-deoxy-D-manno-octulosonic acid transferase [Planctomycetota bacterium]MBI3832877.1 3-deoxy-D-manno-octulosonic acid transferase [Planctomycetota bacterium]
MMRWIANAVYIIAGLGYLPVAIYNALLLKKNRRGWSQRFGVVPRRDPGVPRVWIHAVSLGEINATPRLVEELKRTRPDIDIVFSTTTDTGYARGVQLYGADRVFRFPLDFSWMIGRALKRINPSMIVLVELEVWFNLLLLAEQRGIPVAIVNGRLTAKSARRLSYLGAIGRSMLRRLAWVGAQDEIIANRFKSLGVPADRLEVTSSLKWDTAQVTDKVDGAESLARALGIDPSSPHLVCGSTGDGEESLVLQAYKQILSQIQLQLAIVPRKPERFDEVAGTIEQAGFRCVRRSSHPDGPNHFERPKDHEASTKIVILGDTMGELRKFYSLATVVFIGRSLVPMGGSDPMEVAALGKPILVGPHMENFELAVDALQKARALKSVSDPGALANSAISLLSNSSEIKTMAENSRRVVIMNQGATPKTAARLLEILGNQRDGAHKSQP